MIECGIHRLDLLSVNDAVDIVSRHCEDRSAAGQYADQVGDRHQAVECIGQIPGKLQFHSGSDEDEENKDRTINDR